MLQRCTGLDLSSLKKPNESYAEHGTLLQAHFNKWIDALNVNNDIDRLKEIIMLEQWYDGLNADLWMYLVDKEPATLVEAKRLADAYAVLHRNTRGQTSRQVEGTGNKAFGNQVYKPKSTLINNNKQSMSNYGGDSNAVIVRSAGNFVNKPYNLYHKICYFCQKQGHYVR